MVSVDPQLVDPAAPGPGQVEGGAVLDVREELVLLPEGLGLLIFPRLRRRHLSPHRDGDGGQAQGEYHREKVPQRGSTGYLAASSARFNASTFTRGSPSRPNRRPSTRSSKGCPMGAEPTALTSLTIRLPFACRGNTACAMAVTIAGYASCDEARG